MPTQLFDVAIPVLQKALSSLEHVLKSGEANAKARGIDPDVFLQARLAPDMFNLIGQVRVACALAKACPFRLEGTEPPVYEDTEKTFDDLYALIGKTQKLLAGFKPEQINGKEAREFSIKMGPTMREFTGQTYLAGFILPNVYFHTATAYNILRHNGVPLGKADFFGGLS